jgi:hypothetical protein
MKLDKKEKINKIFQPINQLPIPLRRIADDTIFFTGSIKYNVDFIEDCARICNCTVDVGDDYLQFFSDKYAVYCDCSKQVIYINAAMLAMIEKHRNKITLDLRK